MSRSSIFLGTTGTPFRLRLENSDHRKAAKRELRQLLLSDKDAPLQLRPED
jgi:hypothetical protein